jgi:hypothetical protein
MTMKLGLTILIIQLLWIIFTFLKFHKVRLYYTENKMESLCISGLMTHLDYDKTGQKYTRALD